MMNSECPICESKTFKDFNGRINAQCSNCKSLERSRLMWMILLKTHSLSPKIRILHIAPEICMLEKFAIKYGDRYHPCDIDTTKYNNKFSNVFHIDLCRDASIMPTGIFDLIIHNHVLEHLPCDITPVITDLNRILAPGGMHLFSVPFRGKTTVEDLSPSLSSEERTRRFAQFDHMRLFGVEDFPIYLEKNFPGKIKNFNLRILFNENDMLKANIPIEVLDKICGHSFFYYQKSLDQ